MKFDKGMAIPRALHDGAIKLTVCQHRTGNFEDVIEMYDSIDESNREMHELENLNAKRCYYAGMVKGEFIGAAALALGFLAPTIVKVIGKLKK